MHTNDVTCSNCGAGFKRIELSFVTGEKGEISCTECSTVLEVLDGTKLIAYRMTVQPLKKSSPTKAA